MQTIPPRKGAKLKETPVSDENYAVPTLSEKTQNKTIQEVVTENKESLDSHDIQINNNFPVNNVKDNES